VRLGFLVVSPFRIACIFLHVERGRSSKRVWRSPRIIYLKRPGPLFVFFSFFNAYRWWSYVRTCQCKLDESSFASLSAEGVITSMGQEGAFVSKCEGVIGTRKTEDVMGTRDSRGHFAQKCNPAGFSYSAHPYVLLLLFRLFRAFKLCASVSLARTSSGTSSGTTRNQRPLSAIPEPNRAKNGA
jgi:hypothetical protein